MLIKLFTAKCLHIINTWKGSNLIWSKHARRVENDWRFVWVIRQTERCVSGLCALFLASLFVFALDVSSGDLAPFILFVINLCSKHNHVFMILQMTGENKCFLVRNHMGHHIVPTRAQIILDEFAPIPAPQSPKLSFWTFYFKPPKCDIKNENETNHISPFSDNCFLNWGRVILWSKVSLCAVSNQESGPFLDLVWCKWEPFLSGPWQEDLFCLEPSFCEDSREIHILCDVHTDQPEPLKTRIKTRQKVLQSVAANKITIFVPPVFKKHFFITFCVEQLKSSPGV